MRPTDVTIAPQILLTSWFMVALSGMFIALKILSRLRKRLRLWWDDYVMLISWLCLVSASVCITYATIHGFGRHVQFLDSNARSAVLRFGTISAILTIAASVWSKVSFALFLLRISSSGCTEWIRKVILGLIISLNILYAIVTAIFLFRCRPMIKSWKDKVDRSCWNSDIMVYLGIAMAVYSGVVDLVLASLPWKIIWCLPVRRRDKIGLVAVMSLGVFAAMASFIKSTHIHLVAAEDFSFDGWKIVFWAIFEPTLTIIAACIPVVRTFIRDLVRSFFHRRVSHHPESKTSERPAARGSPRFDGHELASAKASCDERERQGAGPSEIDLGDGCHRCEMEDQRNDRV